MNAKDMRDTYCETLLELAESDARIVVLDSDLMGANGTTAFKARFPERFINVGVAEANMVGIAAGLAAAGKIPFPASFACFSARRAFDQFFISVNYARNKVNLTGTDPGITAQYNGGTHMCFEDIGIMRCVPKLVVYEPCDNSSLRALLKAAAYDPRPTYLRLHRRGSANLHGSGQEYKIGKGVILRDGTDMTIVATGFLMMPEALEAAELLRVDGIDAAVIDLHTVKPLDEELLIGYAKKTKALLTCENHQVSTGMGSAVAQLLSAHYPCPVLCHGVHDEFGEVGNLDYLKQRYGFTAQVIRDLGRKLLELKGKVKR